MNECLPPVHQGHEPVHVVRKGEIKAGSLQQKANLLSKGGTVNADEP
ncbi:hypothetical protein [Nisaea sediminum]|nr:hypothetical protein [Nisaea sediminum]